MFAISRRGSIVFVGMFVPDTLSRPREAFIPNERLFPCLLRTVSSRLQREEIEISIRSSVGYADPKKGIRRGLGVQSESGRTERVS